MKTALVTMARHENKYLKEWLDHYFSIGIEHVIIGDNNDKENDESIQTFIDENGYKDRVTVIDKRKEKNDTSRSVENQPQFFEEVYHQYGKDFDWMCFFDVDEFFETINEYMTSRNINDYIENCVKKCESSHGKTPEQIMVGWLIYGDNDQLFGNNKPVQERFTSLSERLFFGKKSRNGMCGKCIVKCGNEHVKFRDMHVAYTDGDFCTVINGGNNYTMKPYQNNLFIHNDAVLKHYYSKSMEEFFERRLFDKNSFTNYGLKKLIENYFEINRVTTEKIKLLNLYLKLYKYKLKCGE